MLIRLDIQGAPSAVEGLAEWLVRENRLQLEGASARLRENLRNFAENDTRSWWWSDFSGVQATGQVSRFTRAALLVALDRLDGRSSRIALVGNGPWTVLVGDRTFGRLERISPPLRVQIDAGEKQSVRLLNWLAWWNEGVLRSLPGLPLLYKSGARYARESEETWSDVFNLHLQGWEDCDALAAARAGELRARGWRALGRDDPGYAVAREADLRTIPADVVLRTRNGTLYHCICRYRVGSETYYDDPSARLGMFGGKTMTSAEVQSYLGRFFNA